MLMFWGFIFPIALNRSKPCICYSTEYVRQSCFQKTKIKGKSCSSIVCLSRLYLLQNTFKILSSQIISLSIETLVCLISAALKHCVSQLGSDSWPGIPGRGENSSPDREGRWFLLLPWQEEGDGMGWDGTSSLLPDGGPFEPAEQCWLHWQGNLLPCTLCPLGRWAKKSSYTWIVEEFPQGWWKHFLDPAEETQLIFWLYI